MATQQSTTPLSWRAATAILLAQATTEVCDQAAMGGFLGGMSDEGKMKCVALGQAAAEGKDVSSMRCPCYSEIEEADASKYLNCKFSAEYDETVYQLWQECQAAAQATFTLGAMQSQAQPIEAAKATLLAQATTEVCDQAAMGGFLGGMSDEGKMKCVALGQAAAEGKDVSSMRCPCYSEIAEADASKYLNCKFSAEYDETVYQLWQECQAAAQASAQSSPFVEAMLSQAQPIEAAKATLLAQATTEVCDQAAMGGFLGGMSDEGKMKCVALGQAAAEGKDVSSMRCPCYSEIEEADASKYLNCKFSAEYDETVYQLWQECQAAAQATFTLGAMQSQAQPIEAAKATLLAQATTEVCDQAAMGGFLGGMSDEGKMKCVALGQAAAEGKDVSSMRCPCYSEIAEADASKYLNCKFSAEYDETVYQLWQECQAAAQASAQSSPFVEAMLSQAQPIEAAKATLLAQATTEVCDQAAMGGFLGGMSDEGKMKCVALGQAAAEGKDVSSMRCPCYSEIAEADASKYLNCKFSAEYDETVYQLWQECQAAAQATFTLGAMQSQAQPIEAAKATLLAQATTEVCDQAAMGGFLGGMSDEGKMKCVALGQAAAEGKDVSSMRCPCYSEIEEADASKYLNCKFSAEYDETVYQLWQECQAVAFNDTNAEVVEDWTPLAAGAGIGFALGALLVFGLGKLRQNNGRTEIRRSGVTPIGATPGLSTATNVMSA